MAISANVIFDIRASGSDSLNGGAFDPSVTAGMFTDWAATAANTAAPVVTSVSYAFVAGDVGAQFYLASGTNTIPGWYPIASVAGGAATLNATAGAAVLMVNNYPTKATTVDGCATVASPTSMTGSIDYSQQNAAQFSYTDLASAGAGSTVSSALIPFGRQMVGNMLVIASGTNFTAGNYIIASVAAVTFIATVTGAANITSGVGAAGVGGLGGAMATLGKAGSKQVAGSKFFFKNGTYTLTSSTNNVAGGPLSVTVGVSAGNYSFALGWDTVRAVSATVVTRPVIDVAARTSVSAMTQGSVTFVGRFNVTGLAGVSTTGLIQSGNFAQMFEINIEGCRTGATINGGLAVTGRKLLVTGFSTVGINLGASAPAALYDCEIHTGTNDGIMIGVDCLLERVLVYGLTGATSSAFDTSTGETYRAINCAAYNTGNYAFDFRGTSTLLINCHVENATGLAYHTVGLIPSGRLINCSGYNNSLGNYIVADVMNVENFVAITAGSAFTNPGAADFSLNNTAGQGALLRGTGYPQAYPRALTQNREDIGAAQSAAAAAGSLLVNPGMSGGMRG